MDLNRLKYLSGIAEDKDLSIELAYAAIDALINADNAIQAAMDIFGLNNAEAYDFHNQLENIADDLESRIPGMENNNR